MFKSFKCFILISIGIIFLNQHAIAAKTGALRIAAPLILDHSIEFNTSFAAENVFDNNPLTQYASKKKGLNTFMEFDFGSDVTITGFLHHNRGNNVLDQILTSELMFSSDNVFGGSDTVVSLPHTSQVAPVAYNFPAQTVRHVRWDVTGVDPAGTTGNQGAREISFLATSGPMAQIADPTVINSSTPFNTSLIAEKVLDNNSATDYASQGLGTNTFIDFNFGSPRKISGFEFLDRAGSSDKIFFSKLTFSNDPNFVTTLNEVVLHHADQATEQLHAFATQTAQYVRWEVTQTVNNINTNAGAKEIGFYAAIPDGHIPLAAPVITDGATAFNNSAGDFLSGSFSANNMFDGNLTTQYASFKLGAVSAPLTNDGTYLELDLGAVVPLVGVEHLGRGPEIDGIATSRLIVSIDPIFDGNDEVIILDHVGAAVYETFATVNGRYVRWEVIQLTDHPSHIGNVGGRSMTFYSVPEPSSIILFSFGIAGMVAYRNRWQQYLGLANESNHEF